MRQAPFLGKKLLFITAHPDDESYAVGGTIHANIRAGGLSFLICATRGGRGKAHLARALTAAQLKRIRKKELEAAARTIGVTKLFSLDFLDGGISDQKLAVYQKILPIAKKLEPAVMLSFGKDGLSGHRDHVALGGIARRIAKKLKIPFAAFAVSPARFLMSPAQFAKRRKFGTYLKRIVYQAPNARVRVNGRIKIRAVAQHKTQLGGKKPFSHFPPKVRRELLSHEYFRIGR